MKYFFSGANGKGCDIILANLAALASSVGRMSFLAKLGTGCTPVSDFPILLDPLADLPHTIVGPCTSADFLSPVFGGGVGIPRPLCGVSALQALL